LDSLKVQWEYQFLGIRGDAFAKRGEYKLALACYGQENSVMKNNWRSQSYRALDSMSACFKKMGEGAEAAKLKNLSDAVRRGQ
jgi:hypothetical protein